MVLKPDFERREMKNAQNPFNMVFLLKRWYFVRYTLNMDREK